MGLKFNPLTGMFDLVGSGSTGGGTITSVNGDTGPAVTLDTDDVPEGTVNLYFTPERVSEVINNTTSFSLQNNQPTPQDITDLVYDSSVAGFELFATVEIQATTDLFEVFKLTGINRGGVWELYVTSTGTDDSEVEFSITTSGQVQYTTPNYAGFSSAVVKYKPLLPVANVSGGITSVNGDTGPAVILTASDIPYDNTASGLTATELQAAVDELASGAGLDFPLKAPTGTITDEPSYGFAGGDNDTGMYSTGDGNVSFQANGVHRLSIDQNDITVTGDLHITGNIDAANYPPTDTSNRLAIFNNDGDLTTSPALAFDAVDFDGLRINNSVIPAANDEYHTLHSLYASYNPIANSDQGWNNVFIQSQIGTDNSGFQLGDFADIKSTLVLQDITYTSRRYGADGNVISIEYTSGATAGSEVVSGVDFAYSIQIEDGVSTADQIIQAIIDANNIDNISGTIDYVISGTGSNPQTIVGPTNLAGGANANGGVNMMTLDLTNTGTSNMGFGNGYSFNYHIGNNTDQVRAAKITGYGGNTVLADNSSIREAVGYEFGFSTTGTNSEIDGDLRGVNIYGNPQQINGGILGYQLGLNITEARYINSYQTSMNVSGDVLEGINSFADFSNISGDVGNSYFGVAIQPNIGSTDSFFGLNISPNIGLVRNQAVGLNVSMDNVTVFVGAKPSITIQDLFFEAIQPSTYLNDLTIEYIDDGTAGSETVSLIGLSIVVHMESGVSTATQIRTALMANISIVSNIIITITGVGSNPQVTQAPTNLAGGLNPGSKKAAFLDGDVEITGSLAFNGNLSIGKLNAFASQLLADGGGAPGSIHQLITAPTIGSNVTLANADLLGVNTASLITIGDNSVITTAFLGISALGLPAVVSLGSGATVDKIAGATFALSLDAGAAGGTINDVTLCNALALPNATTTVNNLYGYKMQLPFGDVGTNKWGVYIAPVINNYMAGSLKVGGVSDVTSSGITVEIEGKTLLNGDVGFYNTAPVPQQASSGPQAAGVVYTATEQTMIQEMYNALRTYGLLT